MKSCIYEGLVSHCRMAPNSHYFRYTLYMMYLDLSELPDIFDRYLFWSARRPAFAWFNRKDHVGDKNISLEDTIKELIKRENGVEHKGPIRLLTHLRYFGYCMNPVSFYYCWNKADTHVDFIIAEVHNTPWGETHCYVLDNRINQDKNYNDPFSFTKAFHVSPFFDMDHQYEWSLPKPNEKLKVNMNSFENGERVFNASMELHKKPICHSQMSRILLMYPLMTVKVITAIYWQALKLWFKKTPFHSHPKHLMKEIS